MAKKKDAEIIRAAMALYDVQESKKVLGIVAAACYIGASLIAALAPELTWLGVSVYWWAYLDFTVIFLLFAWVAIKAHKALDKS